MSTVLPFAAAPIADWARHYVGLPWKEKGRDRDGVDCWGLVRLCYAGVAAIDLPSYDDAYDSTIEREEIARLFRLGRTNWREITPGREEPLDVAMFALVGQQCHVGVVVGGGKFLHAEQGVGAVIESYRGLKWARRLRMFGRYEARHA